MSYSRKVQTVGAGEDFDGTEDKGLFEWVGDKSGVTIKRIDLAMGVESKSWQVEIQDATGVIAVLESGTDTIANVDIVGEIPVADGESLVIVTSGATSAMRAAVTFRDEPQQHARR